MLTGQKPRPEKLASGCPHLISMQHDRAWVEINLAALAHNVQQLKSLLSPQTDLMAVVKADAYGHGAITVAQTALAHGASWLGVATIPEGIELRMARINAPILILGPTYTQEQVQALVHWQLQPTLYCPKQALLFSETLANLERSLQVHIKLDTGMSRLGINWQQAGEFVKLVSQLPNLQILSIYSHLATADSQDQTVMFQQQQRFETSIQDIWSSVPELVGGRNDRYSSNRVFPRLHLANSAAMLTDPSLHYDLVRAGLAIYGLYPATHLQTIVKLKPVMQVKARVTQVKPIAAHTGVSYGHKFIADREMLIAVVGIGYADGVPRNLSGQMEVLVRGEKVPQIGAITMDQMMLDVSKIPDLELGEVVTLLGTQAGKIISADDWAATLGTISWEILCGFKHRLPRVAVDVKIEK